MTVTSAVTYTSDMADAPDIPDEMRIVDARNVFGAVVEKSRYYDGVTYLTHRGKRVAVVVPVDHYEHLLAAVAALAARESADS